MPVISHLAPNTQLDFGMDMEYSQGVIGRDAFEPTDIVIKEATLYGFSVFYKYPWYYSMDDLWGKPPKYLKELQLSTSLEF